MPNVAGFASAIFNYALNAPAVGATFDLSIDASKVSTGVLAAARLPQVSTSSQGAFPSLTSSLDDATATQLGLKQYLHGTTYNAGIAPTVTAGSGITSIGTVTRALFIPYQCQDGTWRMRFTIQINGATSTSSLGHQINVNGIVFKNVTNYNQSISGYANTQWSDVVVLANSTTINIGHSSAVTPATYGFAGDVELNAKPTWAY